MSDKTITKPDNSEEMEDIRVTLELDGGEVECEILTIFEAGDHDYIALIPLNPDGTEKESGEVYLYRYSEDDEGLPKIDMIESDEEYEIASDRFDEFLDENLYDSMDE